MAIEPSGFLYVDHGLRHLDHLGGANRHVLLEAKDVHYLYVHLNFWRSCVVPSSKVRITELAGITLMI